MILTFLWILVYLHENREVFHVFKNMVLSGNYIIYFNNRLHTAQHIRAIKLQYKLLSELKQKLSNLL